MYVNCLFRYKFWSDGKKFTWKSKIRLEMGHCLNIELDVLDGITLNIKKR